MTFALFGTILDSSQSTFVIIGILVLVLFAIYSWLSCELKVPGPGLRQYLPGGLVYPIYRDHHTFTNTLNALSLEYGDVFQMRLGLSNTLVTAVPEDIAHIASSYDLFPKTSALDAAFNAIAPGGIFTMARELHKATKKALRESFNHSMLTGFHARIVDAADELCGALSSYIEEESQTKIPKVIDISEEMTTATFRVITNVAFGTEMNKEERFQMAVLVDMFMDEIMKEFMGYPIRQALTPFGVRTQFITYQGKIRKVCEDIIKSRLQETINEKEGRHGDMMDAVLSLKNTKTASAVSLITNFAMAGTHTTSQTLAWCIYEICGSPRVQRRIDEEIASHLGDRRLSEAVTVEDTRKIGYFISIWKETLRLHFIAAGLLRKVQRNVTLRGSGITVLKGTQVMAHLQRVHTHERIWDDSMSFRPERWESDSGPSEGEQVPRGCYLPFGLGPRACLGRFLADYEGPLLLIELYRRFRFRLACEPHEVVCCSRFVDTPKTSSKPGGPLDRGIPVMVSRK